MKAIVFFAVAGYVALVALMYFTQRSLLYFPDPTHYAPAAAGLPQAEAVTLTTADGEQVIVWHVAPSDQGMVVLYFQGNGGGLNLRAGRFRELVSGGAGVVALNYRGYGGSSGSPSERGLIADAMAAYDFAAARYPADRIAVWGESLGTGIAVALAAQRPVGRVILESPFTSIADIAASIYWFAPVRLLIKDPFRSDLRAGKITAPVLVMHGAHDNIVPIRFGERLYDMIKAPKRFVRLPHAGHNDHDAYGAVDVAREFLAAKGIN